MKLFIKKYILFMIGLLLPIQILQAQLLWKISGNDLEKSSYIFGTHHLIPIQFLDSVPGLYYAFNRTDIVIGELQMSQMKDVEKLQQATIMPDNVLLKDLLSEEDYELVDAELKAVLQMGLKEMSMLRPGIISTMYTTELYKTYAGITDDTQADSFFQLLASRTGKRIIGLENVDSQIEILLGGKTLEEQAQELLETVQMKDEILQQSSTLDSLYKKGSIDKLMKLSKEEMAEAEYYSLVDRRNTQWVELLPEYIKEAPCFIAVGALHLPGENGLINQLKKMGYKLTPVTK